MSWKVHETDEVFAGLRGMCSNAYRMYDPSEHRYYYDHECDAYECAVEDAAREYERLLKHCEKQREELAAIKNPLGNLKESFGGDMDNIDGGTEVERIEGSSRFEQGSSITDDLREWFKDRLFMGNGYAEITAIADRIDERHEKERDKAYDDGVYDGIDADKNARGYVKLPVDADGVPIKVGDVMEFSRFDVSYNTAVTVVGIGAGVFFSFDEKLGRFAQKDANAYRHVQPDSWERIIEDALLESHWDEPSLDDDDYERCKRVRDRVISELVERCKRLAGDAE